jgi:hypothetical protein
MHMMTYIMVLVISSIDGHVYFLGYLLQTFIVYLKLCICYTKFLHSIANKSAIASMGIFPSCSQKDSACMYMYIYMYRSMFNKEIINIRKQD